jgi:hypothetical protein
MSGYPDGGRGELLLYWLTLDAQERTMLLRALRLPNPLRHTLLEMLEWYADMVDQGGLKTPQR